MSVQKRIVQKLSADFAPDHLEVIDESNKHRGHAGWREGGETHFRVRIGSPALDSLSRLGRHRAVMTALDDEIKAGVHALAIEFVPADAPPQQPPVVATPSA